MYKLILVSILATISAYANQMLCPYDSNKDINPQIESCKLFVLKSLCEQQGIAVWSHTETHNNTLKADQINTKASCSNLGVNVSNIRFSDSSFILTYTSVNEPSAVTEVSMEQWNNLRNVASTKIQLNKRKATRIDSTTVADMAMSIQVDSRKIKTALLKMEDKTNRIINILLED